MSKSNKNMIYRCPVCFARENDIPLHQKEADHYYCVKCSYTGTSADILKNYQSLKVKYKNITKRLYLEDIKKL